ncbi:butyrophilin subfamily 1 member A1-like [Salminus brasiliensis]|uniref:butyrophilin subfamily 1 member A1-like n=1 Tax=Salminus brasiliensis TaxID=930266 RepID=UPI003B8392B9
MLWVYLISTLVCSAAAFSVSVPNGFVSERLGSSAILPCALSPPSNAESFEVLWYETKHNNQVLLYRDLRVQEDSEDPRYRGRASLVGDLQKGNVSLKLGNLVVADGGEYVCRVQSDTWYDKASVNLTVKALGSPPLFSLADAGDQVYVTCASEGWFPKPTLTWRDAGGRELPHSRIQYSTDSEGLVGVSSWLLVPPSGSEWISCSVGLSNQEMIDGRVLPIRGIWKEAFVLALALSLIVTITLTVLLLLRRGLLPQCASQKNAKAAAGVNSESSVPPAPVSAEERLQMWRKLKYNKEKLTLDPDPRPPSLTITQEKTSVYCGQLNISSTEDPFPQVLSREDFSSGRKYWEVLVDQKERCKKSWCVGVTQKPPTKETLRALCYDEQSGIYISTEPNTRIPVEDHFTTLGLLLDFPQNTLSFYIVDKGAHLHTFSIRDMSKHKYCAVISPGVKDQYPVKFS